MVHRHGRDTVAGLHAEPFECLCQAPRIVRNALPIGPESRSIRSCADNFSRSMLAFGVVDQPRDAERKVLHCAQPHRRFSLSAVNNSVTAASGRDKPLLAG
jgi:hypothetical protein